MKKILLVMCMCCVFAGSVAAAEKIYRDPSTGMQFVFVKGGCFEMGDTFSEEKVRRNPPHTVCVDDFYIGMYEVTQGQWRSVMGENPADFPRGDNYPVDSVSWEMAQAFLKKLNAKAPVPYRLPTEAEWEYAAKSGGKKERFAGFSDEKQAKEYGNFCDKNCGLEERKDETQDDGFKNTSPVGYYKPNGLGIYDMSGNLWEWVQDWYDEKYYEKSPKDNPKGPETGKLKVLRGGCWALPAGAMKTYVRGWLEPEKEFNTFGLRLVMPAR